ncbi:transposase [Methylocystis sp. IM3]|uniref:IS66 family transposase n=1 Tax=unclassified Methylocystis TaxID=2625913 RepID=UPI0030F5C13E
MFRRSAAAFAARREQVLAAPREARFLASDETGVRIEGVNAYRWVFHCAQAVVHGAAFTRGAIVVHETVAGHRPEIWTSDRYRAQQGHATRQ